MTMTPAMAMNLGLRYPKFALALQTVGGTPSRGTANDPGCQGQRKGAITRRGGHMSSVQFDRMLKLDSDRVFLTVKVSPKSHRDAIKGIVNVAHGQVALAVGVRPPAAEGAANEAVIGLLANLFD